MHLKDEEPDDKSKILSNQHSETPPLERILFRSDNPSEEMMESFHIHIGRLLQTKNSNNVWLIERSFSMGQTIWKKVTLMIVIL